ncbi:MAG TPA: YezD family protein [Chthoniobacterales bacterium]|jgi:hypothetical protein|nr:YezD family protein [Chthoniobacterales bacterium]
MHRFSSNWLDLVREKVESLRFGVVQITVHDSQVTQIERTEKIRIESPSRLHTDQRNWRNNNQVESNTGLPD